VYDPPINVESKDDVNDLRFAPQDVKDFLAGLYSERYANAKREVPAGCAVDVILTVSHIRTDGWMRLANLWTGSSECSYVVDAHMVFYRRTGRRWGEVIGGHELPSCSVLEQLEIPADIAGDECYDGEAGGPDGEFIPYTHP
jgi:hypothetical protein